MYTYNMLSFSKLLKFHLFADDTGIFLSDKNVNNLEKTVKASNWLTANKLNLKVDKTNVLLISPPIKEISNEIILKFHYKSIKQ